MEKAYEPASATESKSYEVFTPQSLYLASVNPVRGGPQLNGLDSLAWNDGSEWSDGGWENGSDWENSDWANNN
ncbi:hypothetical protein HN747_03410 [archaeon]|jgi:hypothetical protein|nr:hypothetical protein [archaeon]